ncbi:hypothetical protein LP419_06805 [Massilia sp. H-1]|nr:hypothetical protein LP419_06805 [Massilia sp. H-1]
MKFTPIQLGAAAALPAPSVSAFSCGAAPPPPAPSAPPGPAVASAAPASSSAALDVALREVLANYRKIIVLLANDSALLGRSPRASHARGPGPVPRQPGARRRARTHAGRAGWLRPGHPLRRDRRPARLHRIRSRPVRRRPPGLPRTAARLADRSGARLLAA